MAFCKALVVLRNRKTVLDCAALEIFFDLIKIRDKRLRFLFFSFLTRKPFNGFFNFHDIFFLFFLLFSIFYFLINFYFTFYFPSFYFIFIFYKIYKVFIIGLALLYLFIFWRMVLHFSKFICGSVVSHLRKVKNERKDHKVIAELHCYLFSRLMDSRSVVARAALLVCYIFVHF